MKSPEEVWTERQKQINTPISARAAAILWDLSAEFQHGWIGYLPGREWFIDRATRPGWGDEVNAMTEAGIDATGDTIGCVRVGMGHSTQSHTLEWEIAPDGRVEILAFVYTPALKGEPVWKAKKDRRIARLIVLPNGKARVETFGRFPLLGENQWGGGKYDDSPADQYDYSWAILGMAARACGVTLPRRPVDPPERPALRLPRSRARISAAI